MHVLCEFRAARAIPTPEFPFIRFRHQVEDPAPCWGGGVGNQDSVDAREAYRFNRPCRIAAEGSEVR